LYAGNLVEKVGQIGGIFGAAAALLKDAGHLTQEQVALELGEAEVGAARARISAWFAGKALIVKAVAALGELIVVGQQRAAFARGERSWISNPNAINNH
jgi:hypothetical protein